MASPTSGQSQHTARGVCLGRVSVGMPRVSHCDATGRTTPCSEAAESSVPSPLSTAPAIPRHTPFRYDRSVATFRTSWAPGLDFGMVSACNVAWVVLSTSVHQEQIPGGVGGEFSHLYPSTLHYGHASGSDLGGYPVERFDLALVFLIARGPNWQRWLSHD